MMRPVAMAFGVLGMFGALVLGAGQAIAQPVDTLRATPLPGVDFVDARAIGVDPFGGVYVADAGRDVIYTMNGRGGRSAVLGGPGSQEGAFDDPVDVDPTNGLVLYVADAGNRRIQIFSRSGAYLGAVPLMRTDEDISARVTYRRQDEAAADYSFGIPVAVATSSANEIFAVDADRGVVRKWDQDRRPAGVIGGIDAGRGALVDPVDIAVGADRLLYVADRGAESLMVYDQYGTFVRTIGSGLAGLRAVVVDGGRVYAVLAHSLVAYDETGRFERCLEIDMDTHIVDVAAGTDGTLYVLGVQRMYLLAPAE
ncbi:MAG: hypothetical protein F4Y00_02965 [Bacteroidetes bacterium SB0662_bin_6]|nr:hypothetical protein [Bacteroidetes bacterium SB0668_bin_1]MYE03921.1 hypothetical protein [Bacteroidetes bacterium SB0662_bin_6]